MNRNFPWVSANVLNSDGTHAFTPFLMKSIGSIRVAIIGLTGKVATKGVSLADFTITDWENALALQLESIQGKSNFIIVLSSLTHENHQKIARLFPQIDLIISAEKQRGNIPAYLITPTTLITQTSSRGRFLGQLRLSWSVGSKWADPKEQTIAQLQNRLADIEWRINQLSGQLETAGISKKSSIKAKLASLTKKKTIFLSKLENKKQLSTQSSTASDNVFSYRSMKVVPSSAEQDVQSIVEELKSNITNHNKSKRKRRLTTSQNKLIRRDEIGGYTTCGECHPKQTLFWQTTAHSSAYGTLEKNGQNYNTDCLPCHVTGGKITHESLDSDKALLLTLKKGRNTIGCEVCHGPAIAHSKTPETVMPPTRTPEASTCLTCHNSEMDSHFNYSAKLVLIACPQN